MCNVYNSQDMWEHDVYYLIKIPQFENAEIHVTMTQW